MRVELAADVFAGSAELVHILKLMGCFAEGRHDWALTDPAVVPAAVAYFQREAPGQAASVELAAKGTVHAQVWASTPAPTTPVRVVRSEIAHLCGDLCRAAVLVVEDVVSDTFFLHTLDHVFGAGALTSAEQHGWLEIRHGGGTGRMVEIAQQEAGHFQHQIRVAVLFDSDRLVPDATTSSHQRADILRRGQILVHVLELREAENYVPNRILVQVRRNAGASSRKLDYIKRLSPQQRGHFDFKNGFKADGAAAGVPAAQKGLFEESDAATIRALSGGFGAKLLEFMHEHRAELVERDFAGIGPAVVEELRSLVAMVRSLV